ncbi:MAG TPA: amidase [Acidimicrobiales bacterium]|nr:amidase [Acidimicrobiales bacterium]
MDSVIAIAGAVRRGERKAVEVLDQSLDRIAAHNQALNAFVHIDSELARQAAEQVDAAVARGDDPGPLAGVPFGVKDLYDCAGMPTSRGSLLYKGRPPATEDSIHVARLRAAGAVPVGKTATPEFGGGYITDTKAWGTTRNPWNEERSPGGSSGGSAAAVAAGFVPFATSSDGGGSTRIPASFSGLVGFKASHGRIPYPGNSISQTSCAGTLVTTVADAARTLDVMAGPDDRDRVSLPPPTVRYENAIEQLDVRGLRAVWSPDYGYAVVEPEVAALAEEAAFALADATGLTMVDRKVQLTDPVKVWLTSGACDLWEELERGMWPERADEFDPVTNFGLRTTEDLTVARFARFAHYRSRLDEELAAVFAGVDVVLSPTTAIPAPDAAFPPPSVINGETVNPAMAVPFTMAGNLSWNPAVSVPAGTTADGLPVGLQVMGRRHADEVVLRLARLFEQARPWPRHAPGWS